MDSGENDGDLVRRARAGDTKAWDLLVDRLANRVWAVPRALGLARADTEDVFQVTWMRLVSHIDTIREPERVASWLAVTARNESFRLMRRRGRQVLAGDDGQFERTESQDAPPEAGILKDERSRAVSEGVARLPSNCQRLLRLLMADPPFSYEQISEILDLSPGSIGPTRGRCLEKLRRLLASMDEATKGSTP